MMACYVLRAIADYSRIDELCCYGRQPPGWSDGAGDLRSGRGFGTGRPVRRPYVPQHPAENEIDSYGGSLQLILNLAR
jgi:hypothetical protein